MQCPIKASTVALIAAVVSEMLYGHNLHGKPTSPLPATSYWVDLQHSYTIRTCQVVGYGLLIREPRLNGICGAYKLSFMLILFRTNPPMLQGYLSIRRGCAECYGHRRPFTEWTLATGVLVFLTVYKSLSYRKRMNPTWAVPFCAHVGYNIEPFVTQGHIACPWLSCLLYHRFWYVNSSMWQSLMLTTALRCLLACIASTLATGVQKSKVVAFIRMWVNISGVRSLRICPHYVISAQFNT